MSGSCGHSRTPTQAIEPFESYLRETLFEIRIVEFMCGEDPSAAKATAPALAWRPGAAG
jgi:hypothetical protein